MELEGSIAFWGLLALVVFPLAQLPLVFYLARYVTVSEGEPLDHAVEFRDAAPDTALEHASEGSEPERSDRTGESPPRNVRATHRSPPDRSAIACPACGVANDPAFDFCRSCVARLSSRRSVSVAGQTPPQ